MAAAKVRKSLERISAIRRRSIQKGDAPVDLRSLRLGERHRVMINAVPNLTNQVETFFDGQTAEIDSGHGPNLSARLDEIQPALCPSSNREYSIGDNHSSMEPIGLITLIDDPDDPRISAYRDIRERDLVGRDGQFIAEGEVVLKIFLTSGRHQPLSLLIAEKRLAKLAPLLDRVPETVPIYVAGQTVLDAIAGFPLHRGILALGRSAQMPTASDLLAGLGRRALVVMLFGISNHDNMGGIFRNVAAFGADAVILDPGCCDPLYRKAIRVSVGTTLMVPFARLHPSEDAIGTLTEQGFEPIALSPAGDTTLARLARPDRAAVLLGTEGTGLPADVMTRSRKVGIPMAAGVDSLNVATTSGIVLHHLAFSA